MSKANIIKVYINKTRMVTKKSNIIGISINKDNSVIKKYNIVKIFKGVNGYKLIRNNF